MFTKPQITQILLATDLSENANRVFDYATSLAEAYGATVMVLHVLEKLPPNAEQLLVAFLGYRNVDELRQKSEAELIVQLKDRIERFCSEVVDQMPECRLILQKVIVEPGKASEGILHHVSTGTYDAIAIGSRGHGMMQDALLGGTAHRVLRGCRIPVFLIPL